ncbi:MAG TPA: hypothetical protein VMC03_02585 [Streptosporangiaceae bacterium]|nr:hypothetical protein [Streptosporangiaceae bacterium]
MGAGFSVRPSGLSAGGQDMGDLQARCQLIAQYVVATLTSMSGSAGHAGLAAALKGAAGRTDTVYTGMWAAYGHTSQSLAASADTYSSADQAIANQIRALIRGGWRGGPQQ